LRDDAVKPLQVQPLAFPESELLRWKKGNYEILARSRASSFLKQILDEKARNRSRPGRRFFGEAFVATRVDHEEGWYGSFKWLTSLSPKRGSAYAKEYRAALKDAFPSVSDLPSRALALCDPLEGKKPVPPDLWLIVNGEHQFIEVKLPGDDIRSTQIAGLALIATCLSRRSDVSVWLYNLYPEGGRPDAVPESVQAMYSKFCGICRRPNKRLHPTALGTIVARRE
jgi:hypothetical protein